MLAISRLISWAENREPGALVAHRRVFPRTGTALRIGITGPPGAGKSTLIARWAQRLVSRGHRVAVVAVDPTSPFSGGALLGDRYRMADLVEDPGVFVRSMATRGTQGGLAEATATALDFLDAAGFDRLLIETVGVGQVEADVVRTADTVAVVLVPESGDSIQAMKAGLMEIGDVFAINKADREGADRLANDLSSMIDLRAVRDGWRPPVVKTVATTGEGMQDLLDAVDAHHEAMISGDGFKARRREVARFRLLEVTRRGFLDRLRQESGDPVEDLTDRVAAGELTPADAAKQLMDGTET